jgi:hypothetical protein
LPPITTPTPGTWSWPVLWSAKWIWTALPSQLPTGNHVGFLRRRFWLDAVPESVPSRVTADSRFVLSVNGAEVSRGPARNVPERQAFHEVDLAPSLRPGWNVVAAVVRHYGAPTGWWRPPAPFGEIGHGGFAFEAPAIGVASDSAWRALSAPWLARPAGNDPVREVVEGAELPVGWLEEGFDDSAWTSATELSMPALGGLPSAPPTPSYSGMEPAGIAEQTRLVRPTRVVATGWVPTLDDADPIVGYDPDLVLDAGGDRFTTSDVGEMTHGTLSLAVRADAGTVVDLYVGEDVSEVGLAVIEPRRWVARYVAAGREEEVFENFDPIGFRYVTAVVRGAGEVTSLQVVERLYPTSGAASFSCSDERLERIWRVGARTLELCAVDAFIDCPGREQNAWVGDSYLHTLLAMVTNSDWRLVRRNLRIGSHSRRPDGFLSAISAGGASTGAFNIPEYSAYWIRSLCRYVERSGDLDLALELLPAATEVVAAFERHRDVDGLLRVPGIVFVDWAQTERGVATAAVDALYAAALVDYASLCDWVGYTVRADRAREAHAASAIAFEQLWDESRGVYVDALHAGGVQGRRVSQQTNALAIVSGLAPASRWAGVLDVVLDPARVCMTLSNGDLPEHEHWLYQRWEPAGFDAEHDVVAAQPFMRHFLHQAVVLAGGRDRIAALCLEWLRQLERGNTAFEEFWDAPAGMASRCHAWSATPTYDLTTHVLGVRPVVESAADLGFRRVVVEPALHVVDQVSGTVPTPHGDLEITLTTSGGRLRVPDGIKEVVLRLAEGDHVFGAGDHDLPAR